MKTITASSIPALQKAVNDYIFTNTAYIPTMITRSTAARKKAKEAEQKETTKQSFTALLTTTTDSSTKSCSLFYGSLEALSQSEIAQIAPRHIKFSATIPADEGRVFAIIVQ